MMLYQVTYQHAKTSGRWITTNFHSEERAEDYMQKLRNGGWKTVVLRPLEIEGVRDD